MSTCLERALVDRHFRGTILPLDERRMRAHLPGCQDCRAHYERWLLLAEVDPAVAKSRERLGRGLGLDPRGRAGAHLGIYVVAAAAMASVVALTASARLSPMQAGTFASRGAADASASPEIMVYRAPHLPRPGDERDRPPTAGYDARPPALLATAEVGRDDELSFAYTNPTHAHYAMIFAVDRDRRLYWYYPEWTDPEGDPVSVPIEEGAASHDLPDAVRHDLRGDTLTLYAVLGDTPLHVRDIESRISADTPLTTSSFASDASAVVVTRTLRLVP